VPHLRWLSGRIFRFRLLYVTSLLQQAGVKNRTVSEHIKDTKKKSVKRKKESKDKKRSKNRSKTRKRKREASSSSSSSSDDSSSSSSSSSEDEKEAKRRRKKAKKAKKLKRKARMESKQRLNQEISVPEIIIPLPVKVVAAEVDVGPHIDLKSSKIRAPMTKEEYEKQQNTLTWITDSETGRRRYTFFAL